jgi:DNA repair protein RadC
MSFIEERELARLTPGMVIRGPTEEEIAEPLARLVGSRPARTILEKVGGTGVAAMNAPELASACGIPLRLAERVVAARAVVGGTTRTPCRSGTASTAILSHLPTWLAEAETEYLIAFALGTQLDVKAMVLIAKGGASRIGITPKDVFVPLIRLNASSFVVVHNHPGGNPTPSRDDVAFTNSLACLGRTLGLTLLDHIIVARLGALSFCDAGLMPTHRELDQLGGSTTFGSKQDT